MASITSGIIRFCRPLGITEVQGDVVLAPSNLGGIVFAIDIHHEEQQLHVGYSICRFDDNFNKKLGTELALKALSDDKGIIIPYNKDLSLLENIIHAVDPDTELSVVGHSSNDVNQKRFQTLQRALFTTMFTTLGYSDYIYDEFTKLYTVQEQTIH